MSERRLNDSLMESLPFRAGFPLDLLCRRAQIDVPKSLMGKEVFMLDIMFIAIGLAFLGGAMLYARACDRL